MKEEFKDFDLWEQAILKYLSVVGISLTVRRIATETLMSPITCKKKLKGLELKGKVKSVKKGKRIKYEILQEIEK